MNINQDIAQKLFEATWNRDMLADTDTINSIVGDIFEGKQYFTAEEVIELLTQDL